MLKHLFKRQTSKEMREKPKVLVEKFENIKIVEEKIANATGNDEARSKFDHFDDSVEEHRVFNGSADSMAQSSSAAPSEVENHNNNQENLPQLKWHRDSYSPSHSPRINEIKEEHYPLVHPMHLKQFAHKTEVKFDHPIDYLINWHDTHDCCGMVKSEDDLDDKVPIVIRLGGYWCDKAVRTLYVGCTVRVKSFYRVGALGNNREEAEIVSSPSCISKIMFSGIPAPTGFAAEWAVIHKPKITRTLGMVTEDMSLENKAGTILNGLVRDYEFNEELMVCHEKWPIPQIKKVPEYGRTVVINYVEIDEPHSVYQCRDKGLLMPAYMGGYNDANYHDNTQFFAWIDLTMEPRQFDSC
ncbi:unnamed protein product [Bursaphelenchus okinawaensis]|uniref:Uncharacterized protein n=1 Tax=Bursaphelenchus okinawaensis TaxID=465554 RepID=A0A811LPP2_9BILA|nr:unnamed protein product [Bursaphelenchus okinawaensis]CAG9127236.1 unnamed protein product [Bursaphelenchus okinawaensis]